MNKNILVILVLLAIGYSGCKNDPYAPSAPAPANSYFPETFGSTWTYRDSIFGQPADTVPIFGVKIDTLTYVINGATTDINSLKCYDAEVHSVYNGAPGTAYFYYNSQLYGLIESTPPYGLMFLQLLKDNASAGYTWLSYPICTPINGSLLTTKPVATYNTIKETNITRVIGGKTFTNVIHTTINLQIDSNGMGFKNIAFYDFYLAKGIGVIEKDAHVYGFLNETETILSYNIK